MLVPRVGAALLLAVTVAGCGSGKHQAAGGTSAESMHEARALTRAADHFARAIQRVTGETAVELDKSFNSCAAVTQARERLPSEAQLEPFDRTLYYRAWIAPYAAYERSVRSMSLTDPGLRPAKGAVASMLRYLRRFKNARGSDCGLLRAWRTSGFSRPFDIARYAGVAYTAPSEGELRAPRAALATVARRLRKLGVAVPAAHRFVIGSDPFR